MCCWPVPPVWPQRLWATDPTYFPPTAQRPPRVTSLRANRSSFLTLNTTTRSRHQRPKLTRGHTDRPQQGNTNTFLRVWEATVSFWISSLIITVCIRKICCPLLWLNLTKFYLFHRKRNTHISRTSKCDWWLFPASVCKVISLCYRCSVWLPTLWRHLWGPTFDLTRAVCLYTEHGTYSIFHIWYTIHYFSSRVHICYVQEMYGYVTVAPHCGLVEQRHWWTCASTLLDLCIVKERKKESGSAECSLFIKFLWSLYYGYGIFKTFQ